MQVTLSDSASEDEGTQVCVVSQMNQIIPEVCHMPVLYCSLQGKISPRKTDTYQFVVGLVV
jgi:hypothetical protein